MNHCRPQLVGFLGALLALAFIAVSASATGSPLDSALTISGAPGNGLAPFSALTLTMSQLAALPQQTVTVSIDGVSTSESGPSLSALLSQAGVEYISACKNDELRYWIEVSGADGSRAEITAGEIDPSFGNKPAILSISEDGSALTRPRLIVPGDATDVRDIQVVTNITIGRAAPQLAGSKSDTSACTPAPFTAPVAPTPPSGSVLVNGDVAQPMELTYAQLAALPQATQTDSYQGPHGTSTNTETGPTLFDVLSSAEPRFKFCNANELRSYVEVTSSEDGYATLVSWAEIDPADNGNPVLLSLTENGHSTLSTDTDPRLTLPGDVDGGRYVSGAAVITLFGAPRQALLRGCGLTPKLPEVPQVTVPGVTVPGVTVPGVTVPTPKMPTVAVRTATVPMATVPKPRVPGFKGPGAIAPAHATPTGTTPTATTPTVTTPTVTTPTVTLPTPPKGTVPTVTLPTVAIPTVTAPTVTVPTVTVPPVKVPPIKMP